jgi:hypothetical protein
MVGIIARRFAGDAKFRSVEVKPLTRFPGQFQAFPRSRCGGDTIHCVLEGAIEHRTPELTFGRLARRTRVIGVIDFRADQLSHWRYSLVNEAAQSISAKAGESEGNSL